MERLKELFKCSIVARRILGIPLLFLVFYYIVQVNYQLDDWMHVMCPRALARPLAAAGNGTETGKKTAEETCRDWMKMTFDENNKNYATITKLITFLLGFYVSRIINQWWNKVCYYLHQITNVFSQPRSAPSRRWRTQAWCSQPSPGRMRMPKRRSSPLLRLLPRPRRWWPAT